MRLALGLGLPYGSFVELATSAADGELENEANGLALSFTDSFFLNSTGHYGSARVKDTSTPANNYNSHPFGLVTYSSPSVKLCRGPSGTLRYGAHNLVPNSEDTTKWSQNNVTVTPNATVAPDGTLTADLVVANTTSGTHLLYPSTENGPFAYNNHIWVKSAGYRYVAFDRSSSVISSSAPAIFDLETGTVISAGEQFDEGSVTIEPGINGWFKLSGVMSDASLQSSRFRVSMGTGPDPSDFAGFSGDNVSGIYIWGAHLRRLPSDDTYLKTTDAAVYELPYEWDENGDPLGVVDPEPQATNLALWSNDLTQSDSWTASDITAAKTATGPDGVENSATTLTATDANGTILQAITSEEAERITSCYIRRRTGTTTAAPCATSTAGSRPEKSESDYCGM